MNTANKNQNLVHKLKQVDGLLASIINSFKEIIKTTKGDCYV